MGRIISFIDNHYKIILHYCPSLGPLLLPSLFFSPFYSLAAVVVPSVAPSWATGASPSFFYLGTLSFLLLWSFGPLLFCPLCYFLTC
jgi:hypothetical protein